MTKSKSKSNIIAFNRRRIAGKFLPTRQTQRDSLLKGRRKYALVLTRSTKWLVDAVSRVFLKTLSLVGLVFLRLLRGPLKIAGKLCQVASVVLPLVGLYLYFNPYAHITSQLWQKGLMWEVLAICGAALWAFLEMVFQTTERKLGNMTWHSSAV